MKKFLQEINLRPKNFNNLLIGTALFLIFLLLLILVVNNIFMTFDIAITDIFQAVIPRTFDVPLSIFSLFGSVEFTTLILIILVILSFRFKKTFPTFLSLFFVVLVFELIGKFFLYHPGPPRHFFRYSLPFSTPEYINTGYSFPSGHVGRTTFLIVVAIFLVNNVVKKTSLKKTIYLLLITYITLMIISRIYLGEHWTSDVLGGLLLGSALGFLAMVYY